MRWQKLSIISHQSKERYQLHAVGSEAVKPQAHILLTHLLALQDPDIPIAMSSEKQAYPFQSQTSLSLKV